METSYLLTACTTNLQKQTATAGTNPFACLGAEVRDGAVFFKELRGGKWIWAEDLKSMPAGDVAYKLGSRTNFTLDQIFPSYDWGPPRERTEVSDRFLLGERAATRGDDAGPQVLSATVDPRVGYN